MEEAIRLSLQEQKTSPPAEKAVETPVASNGKVDCVVDCEGKITEAASLMPAPKPSAPLEDEVRSLSSIGSTHITKCGSNSSLKDSSPAEVEVETVDDDEEKIKSVAHTPLLPKHMPKSEAELIAMFEAKSPTSKAEFFATLPEPPTHKLKSKEELRAMFQTDVVKTKSPTGSPFASEVSPVKADELEESVPKEMSFSENGQGDVADLLGMTLDKCAQAIDAMVLELDRTPSSDSSESCESSYVGVKTDEGSVEEDAGETEGATILESTEDEKASGEEESNVAEPNEGDWQVVTEDNQINDDEQLARAAQMIGSALFNSDMRSSGEIMSNMTASAAESDADADAISFASSVPTSVPSVASIAPVQFERWGEQLEQLHHLGIDDDARCVEILERLSAANIGCDATDNEVSINRVVDEFFGN